MLESEEGLRALEKIEEDSLAEEIPENIRIPRARVQYPAAIQRFHLSNFMVTKICKIHFNRLNFEEYDLTLKFHQKLFDSK